MEADGKKGAGRGKTLPWNVNLVSQIGPFVSYNFFQDACGQSNGRLVEGRAWERGRFYRGWMDDRTLSGDDFIHPLHPLHLLHPPYTVRAVVAFPRFIGRPNP